MGFICKWKGEGNVSAVALNPHRYVVERGEIRDLDQHDPLLAPFPTHLDCMADVIFMKREEAKGERG